MADYFSNEWIKRVNYFNWSKRSTPRHKQLITNYNIRNMLLRTSRMFTWKGLPKEMPQRFLELVLQSWGYIGIVESDNIHYCCWGTLGGEPNYNYMPSKFIVANPHIGNGGLNKEYNIYGDNKNVVVIPNDTLYRGLMPILTFHSELNTEIQLTKRLIIINERMPNALTAPDNNAMKDIKEFLGDVEDGELASVFDRNMMRKVESIPYGEGRSANLITQIIEMEQYQKASLFNDLGLQANYNMKRETLTSSENLLNIDALLPLCDDMLEMRQIACNELKEVFGLDISVDFSSAWKMLRDNLELEKLKAVNEVANSRPNGNCSNKEEVQSTEQSETSNEEVQSTKQEEYTVSDNPDYEDSVDKSMDTTAKVEAEIIEEVVKEDLKEGENSEIVQTD